MTNYEWLLQMGGEERQAWFDAEHVELCEGSSKVRAGSSKSAKRAAAVERLKDARYHTLADYVRAMLGWGHEPHFEDCRDALIDLLTDEPMDAQRDSNGTCPDGDGTASNDSREKLEVEASELVADYAASGEVCDPMYNGIIELLDRQAAITEEKTRYKWVTASAEEIAAWRSKAEKLKEQVYELTAERDALADDLLACNKEREEYRRKLSDVLDLIYRAYYVGSGAYD